MLSSHLEQQGLNLLNIIKHFMEQRESQAKSKQEEGLL